MLARRRALLLIACLLLLAGGVATLLSVGAREAVTPGGAGGMDAAAPGGGGTSADGAPRGGPPLEGLPGRQALRGPEPRPSLEDPRAERPRGRIRGFVREAGKPVAGATVKAAYTGGTLAWGVETFATWWEDATPLWLVSDPAALCAVTDAGGRFELQGLPVGAYRLTVEDPHDVTGVFAAEVGDRPPWVVLDGTRDAFRSVSVQDVDRKRWPAGPGPGPAIEGVLRVPAGAPTSGLEVVALAEPSEPWRTRVPVAADGRFRVDLPEAGRYAFEWQGEGDWTLGEDPRGLSAPGRRLVGVQRDRTTPVELELVTAGALEGRVVGSSGQALARRSVLLLLESTHDAPLQQVLGGAALLACDPTPSDLALPARVVEGSTGEDGRYRFAGVAPGRYRVRVPGDLDLALAEAWPALVRAGETTQLEHVLGAGGSLELLGPNGAMLGLRRRGAGGWVVVLRLAAHAVGAVRVPGLPVGDYEVHLVSPAAGTASTRLADFRVTVGRTTFVDARHGARALARLRLVAAGRPVSGARVRSPVDGGVMFESDEDGYVAWPAPDGPEPRSVTLSVEPPGPHPFVLEVNVTPSGEETLVRLPSGGVELTILDEGLRPVAGAVATASRKVQGARLVVLGDGSGPRATTDAQGRATLPWLPAGTWVLHAESPDETLEAHARVEVADERVAVELRLAPARR